MNPELSTRSTTIFKPRTWIVLILLVPVATGFQFYLNSGDRRCFTESARSNTKVLGEYTVSTGKGHMPVDISVRVSGEFLNLYSNRNIDHGKFAFVVPYRESHTTWKLHAAEVHRKKMQGYIGDVFRQASKNKQNVRSRKLLSTRLNEKVEGMHRGYTGERRLDGHGRVMPPEHYASQHQQDADSHMGQNHGEEEFQKHRHDNHHDHDDGFDELDDFDMNDYDGIDDADLDNEVAEHEAARIKEKGSIDTVADAIKEAELFESQRFEICVFNEGEKGVYRRRVRLMVHKGETAHDYARLAKKKHMTQLEVSLRRISEELQDLMHELDRARQMENALSRINDSTNRRVMTLAFISLVTLAAVSGYQVLYTKRFLKWKKVL